MADNERLKNLERERRVQKDILDSILSQARTDEERSKIKKGQLNILSAEGKSYREHLDILTEINSQVKDIQSENRNLIDDLIAQESKLKGLNGLEASLVGLNRQRLTLQQDLGSETQSAINSIATMNQELLTMSAEDSIARHKQNDLIEQQLLDLFDTGEISHEILENLQRQRDVAFSISAMTEKQQKFLNKQLEVYEGIRDTLGGILETASILTSGPAGIFGMSLIGAGIFVNKLGEVRSQLGGISEFGTTAISFLDDNAIDNAKELAAQFGGMNNVSGELQASVSLISTNMGISGVEAASLAGSFARLNDGSAETALNLTKATQEFASQNGIIPSELMKDLAGSAEEFALFGKDGGKNLIRAGAAAKKMGVELKTMTGIADNLLDFETSITKELELGVLMGRNINLDKARQLAYSNDIEGATREALHALGGITEFNKMDYYQKKATADLLGISAAELQKMVSAEEEAAKMAGTIKGEFNALGESINAGLNKYLGTSLEALGGMVMAGAQLGGSFAMMGMDLKGMASNIPLLGRLFKPPTEITPPQTPNIPMDNQPDINKKGGVMESISKIKMSEVLKGAAAMLIVSAAVFVFGKAVQEFMKVSWESVGMAIVSMLALVGAVVLLGLIMTSKIGALAILAGAAAMVVIATSLLILGNALQAIGTGFDMLGNGISTLLPNILSLLPTLAGLTLLIPAITLLSASLLGLSASLIALGAAGLIAAPGLMALTGIGTIAVGIGKSLGIINNTDETVSETGNKPKTELSEYHSNMLSKMDELIMAVRENRDVYIDKEKVTSVLKKKFEEVTKNTAGVGINGQGNGGR